MNSKLINNLYYFYAFGVLFAGLAYLFYPLPLMEFTLGHSPAAAALTDMRATYGGFQMAIGIYLITLSKSPAAMIQGFRMIAVLLLVVGSVRGLGVFFDGGAQALNIAATAFELLSAGVAFLGSKKLIAES